MFANITHQRRRVARQHAENIRNSILRSTIEWGLILEILFTEQLANEQRRTLESRQEQFLEWVTKSSAFQTALLQRRALEVTAGADTYKEELGQLAKSGRKRRRAQELDTQVLQESGPDFHTCMLHSGWAMVPENIADVQFDFASAYDEVANRLPHLTQHIFDLMKNTRKDNAVDYRQRFSEHEKTQIANGISSEQELIAQLQRRDEKARRGPVLMVIAIIAGQFAPNTTRGIQHLIGFYLQSLGVRRNAIGFLNDMGVCISWDRVDKVQGPLIKHALQRLPHEARKESFVLVQDNFDFLSRVTDEDFGHHNKFYNLTTSIGFHIPNVPPPSTPILRDAIRAAVVQAVQLVHPVVLGDETTSARPLFEPTTLPGRIRQKSARTDVFPLPAVHANSGRTDGFCDAQKMIWQDYLGIKQDNPFWRDRICITIGDQKTAAFGRSAALRFRDSANKFAIRNWQLIPPALWHVKLNFIRLIARTHLRTNTSLPSNATMQADADFLRLKCPTVPESAEYKPTRRLIQKMWAIRICALLYERLIQGGDLQKPSHQRELLSADVERVLLTKRKASRAAVEWITDLLLSPETWNDNHSSLPRLDGEFISTRRFLVEAAYFQVLDAAIRTGATDVIQDLLPRLAALFYGAGKSNYGYEMLYLHWLLQPSTSDPPLRDAILAASLVPQHKDGSQFISTDLMLEHHNKEYKLDIRDHKNSTHTILHTSNKVGTLSSVLKRFRPALENAFGSARSNPRHTESHDTTALYNRAVSLLYKRGVSTQQLSEDQQWFSDNIFKKSTSMLQGKIESFNNDRKHGTVTMDEHEGADTAHEVDNFDSCFNSVDDSDEDIYD